MFCFAEYASKSSKTVAPFIKSSISQKISVRNCMLIWLGLLRQMSEYFNDSEVCPKSKELLFHNQWNARLFRRIPCFYPLHRLSRQLPTLPRANLWRWNSQRTLGTLASDCRACTWVSITVHDDVVCETRPKVKALNFRFAGLPQVEIIKVFTNKFCLFHQLIQPPTI